MALLAMPLIVTNLGCEMVYILDQRLKAQSIPTDKAAKVLRDVVATMFDATYVDKLFSPQEMYTVSSTRKIFDRLAHSSIMRLSESRCVWWGVGDPQMWHGATYTRRELAWWSNAQGGEREWQTGSSLGWGYRARGGGWTARRPWPSSTHAQSVVRCMREAVAVGRLRLRLRPVHDCSGCTSCCCRCCCVLLPPPPLLLLRAAAAAAAWTSCLTL